MELFLVDTNPEMVEAWQREFEGCGDVYAVWGDILEKAENTIVSPANSYGYMDGGIDRAYTDYFGFKPQEEIQKRIRLRSEGYLPVGAAVFVATGNEKIPYMISAPTMLSPGPVNSCNAFFAMSAILQIAHQHRKTVTRIFCPGLATGIGRVPYESAAKEMAAAYKKWRKRPRG